MLLSQPGCQATGSDPSRREKKFFSWVVDRPTDGFWEEKHATILIHVPNTGRIYTAGKRLELYTGVVSIPGK